MTKNEVDERRIFNRMRFAEPIELQSESLGLYGGTLGCDISPGGLRINLNDFVPLHSNFVLQFSLKNKSTVECAGRVVWISKLPYGDRYQAGIEFDVNDENFKSKREIQRYMHTA